MFDNIISVENRNGITCHLIIDIDEDFWIAYMLNFSEGVAAVNGPNFNDPIYKPF